MTRSQQRLAAQRQIALPTAATVKIRHHGSMQDFRLQLGPCGLRPGSGRKAALRAELGQLADSEMTKRLQGMFEHPQRYFSQHRLPKAAEPLWRWVRDVHTMREQLQSRHKDLLLKPFSARVPLLYQQLLAREFARLKLMPRKDYYGKPAHWKIDVQVFDDPGKLNASCQVSTYSTLIRLWLPRNWGPTIYAAKRSCWWRSGGGYWLRLHRIGTAEILVGPFVGPKPVNDSALENLQTLIKEVPHDRGSEA